MSQRDWLPCAGASSRSRRGSRSSHSAGRERATPVGTSRLSGARPNWPRCSPRSTSRSPGNDRWPSPSRARAASARAGWPTSCSRSPGSGTACSLPPAVACRTVSRRRSRRSHSSCARCSISAPTNRCRPSSLPTLYAVSGPRSPCRPSGSSTRSCTSSVARRRSTASIRRALAKRSYGPSRR